MTKVRKLSELSPQELLNFLIYSHNKFKDSDDFYYASYMKDNFEEILKLNNKENDV